MNKTDKPRTFKLRTAGRWPKQKRPEHGTPAQLRAKYKFTKFSRWFRGLHPICFDPFDTHSPGIAMTTSTHHIISIERRPDLIYDEDNCAGLCGECHNRIERQEAMGRPTQHLFEKGPSHERSGDASRRTGLL